MILEAKVKPRNSAFQCIKKIWIPSGDDGDMDVLANMDETRNDLVEGEGCALWERKERNLRVLIALPTAQVFMEHKIQSVLGTHKPTSSFKLVKLSTLITSLHSLRMKEMIEGLRTSLTFLLSQRNKKLEVVYHDYTITKVF